MALWSTKRRFIYGGVVILLTAILAVVTFFSFVYRPSTCSDGVENADEKGVDCGGSCKNLCTSEALNPIVRWSKIFNITGDVYSAVALVENPNINSKNEKAFYNFKIYDTSNKLILEKSGETSIPKNKKFVVLEAGIILKNVKPKSADFQFTSFSTWEKDTTKEPDIYLKYSTLIATSTSPRIEGTITNNSTANIPRMELDVFVLDSKENVVAVSRTFIDDLLARTSQDFVFTWPRKFDLGVESCINPLDIVLALDKSGSMKSESINPPEPFMTVVNTAKDFIKNLGDDDQASIVSFGNESKQESILSSNKQMIISSIDNIFFSTTTNEQTNIFGGLTDSFSELSSSRVRSNSKKVIILLTDGIPTLPKDLNKPDFPYFSAREVSKKIYDSNIILYTIGLGKDLNDSFLKSISTSDSHYYFAPNKSDLSSIYKSITSVLCERKPNVITVMYRSI